MAFEIKGVDQNGFVTLDYCSRPGGIGNIFTH
jgi:hypothetical protein